VCKKHIYKTICLLTATFIIAQNVLAVEYSYTIFSSFQRSDNIAQTTQEFMDTLGGDQKGDIWSTGIRFGLASDPNVLLATNLSGSVSRNLYSVDQLKDETNKDVTASLLLQPKTNNFRLALLDSIRQVPLDRAAVQSVNNTADINVFTAIPSYFIKLSDTSKLEASYAYSKIDDEQLKNERETKTSTLSYERQLNSSLSWSMNFRNTDTLFVEQDFEYELDQVFLRLHQARGITQFIFEIGEQELVDMDVDRLLSTSLSINRRINSNSNLELGYRQGYSDLVNIDVSNNLVEVDSNDLAAFAEGIVKEKQLSLTYDYSVRYFSWNFQLFGSHLEDEDVGQAVKRIDEQRSGGRISASYQFYSRKNDALSYGLTGGFGYEKTEFNLSGLENEINTANLRLNYFATQYLTTFIEVSSRNTRGTGLESNTDEHRVSIGFEWSPRGEIGL